MGVGGYFSLTPGHLNSLVVQDFDVVINWGSASVEAQKTLWHPTTPKQSFLLQPANNPASLATLPAQPPDPWYEDKTKTVSVALSFNSATKTSASTVNPVRGALDTHVRLDFNLIITVNAVTETVLAFRQLFDAASMTPLAFAFEEVVIQRSVDGQSAPTQTKGKRRVFDGVHPLLSCKVAAPSTTSKTKTANVVINAEFVDITMLWWKLNTSVQQSNDASKCGCAWYHHPTFGGRADNLRVLGWTTGHHPMIWFAVIPDRTVRRMTGTFDDPSDVVYFRPSAGVNANSYSTEPDGLYQGSQPAGQANTKTTEPHSEMTMYMLARYLLSPIPTRRLGNVTPPLPLPGLLAAQIQRNNQGDGIASDDPMPDMKFLYQPFRPVGLERSLGRSPLAGGILLLPLASKEDDSWNMPYEGACAPGLKDRVATILKCLWARHATGRASTTTPNLGDRSLYLAGHSNGNVYMWTAAESNAEDVQRLITHDPSGTMEGFDRRVQAGSPPVVKSLDYAVGSGTRKGAITKVVEARNKLNLRTEVVIVATPHLGHEVGSPMDPWIGYNDTIDYELRRTGATVMPVPDPKVRTEYWSPDKWSKANRFLRDLLHNWTNQELHKSASRPSAWRFLFFHEMASYGGDYEDAYVKLKAGGAGGGAQTSGGEWVRCEKDDPGAVPVDIPDSSKGWDGEFVSFFEMALKS